MFCDIYYKREGEILMENYKDYFRGWITNCDKEYVELKNLYDMANADFDNRFKDSLSARANDAGSINSPQTAPSDKIQKGIPEGLDSFTKSLNNFTNNLEIQIGRASCRERV